MRLLWAKGKDFGPFAHIDWRPPATGLHLLDALNVETGRSNMSGKSRFIEGIFWSVFGWLAKWGGPKGGSADAVIRYGQKSCWFETAWQVGQDVVVIKRKRPSSLSVTINGKPEESKDLQRVIEQYLYSPARFLRTIYMSQNRNEEAATKSFFTMSDTERTELLSVVAGLEDLDKALVQSKIERDVLEKDLNNLDGRLKAQRERLAELPAVVDKRRSEFIEAGRAEASAEDAVRNARLLAESQSADADATYGASSKAVSDKERADLEPFNSEITAVTAKYRVLEADLAKSPQIEPELQAAIETAKSAYNAAVAHNKARAKIEAANQKHLESFERLLSEADEASKGSCQSCGQELQEWSREQAFETKKIAAQLEFEKMVSVPMALPEDDTEYQAALAAWNARKAQLEAQPAKIRAELQSHKSRLGELTARANGIKAAAASERGKLIVELESKKKAMAAAFRQTESALEAVVAVRKRAASELADALEEQARVEGSVGDTEASVKLKGAEKDLAMDMVDLFGPRGYRSVCFDGLVERIGQRASQLLSIMTDGLYLTKVKQLGNDAKGNNKFVLRPTITKGGQPVPDDDLSGAGRQHAMLAYDIAVSDATDPEAPLFLDEALDGLDAQGKAEAMAMLEQLARTRLVVVVDHASECKAAFNQILTIHHRSGISSLGGSEDERNGSQEENCESV